MSTDEEKRNLLPLGRKKQPSHRRLPASQKKSHEIKQKKQKSVARHTTTTTLPSLLIMRLKAHQLPVPTNTQVARFHATSMAAWLMQQPCYPSERQAEKSDTVGVLMGLPQKESGQPVSPSSNR